MCLSPITLYNRSSLINLAGSPCYQQVPCGNCKECNDKQYEDYFVRAYYHFKSLSKRCPDAFLFTDTLTYNEEHLPVTHDIAHFCKKDIQDFLKRLRSLLELDGFEVSSKIDDDHKLSNLSYFLASEYGGENHRPHYHISFYCAIPGLDRDTFKKYINRAWCKFPLFSKVHFNQFGEPEGPVLGRIIKRSKQGVKRLVLAEDASIYRIGFTDSWYHNEEHTCRYHGDLDTSFLKALHYVSKYIHKDQDFQQVVDEKIAQINEQIKNNELGEDDKKQFLEDLKDMQPFHLQSKGFGLGFFMDDDFKPVDFDKDAIISLPDSQKGVALHDAPMYYKRKRFYDLIYFDDPNTGETKARYELNNIGLSYKTYQFDKVYLQMCKRYQALLDNASYYVCKLYKDDAPQRVVDFMSDLRGLFNGRTISDFVRYVLCYKGQILGKSKQETECLCAKLDLSKYKDFYFQRYYGCLVFSPLWSDDYFERKRARCHYRSISIYQDSRPEFNGFDDLFNLFGIVQEVKANLVQKREDHRQKLLSKFKLLYDKLQ